MWLVVDIYFCEQDCLGDREQDYLLKLMNFILWSHFRFPAKVSGKYRFPLYPLFPHRHNLLPSMDIPCQHGTFVTTDESTLTYHCHQELTQGAVHPMGLHPFIMTWIHPYSVTHNSFSPLTIICAPPVHLSLPRNSW